MIALKDETDQMLVRAYLLFAIDTASAMMLSYILIYFLPKPLDLIATFSATGLIMIRSITYILKIVKVRQIKRMYIDDGDEDE